MYMDLREGGFSFFVTSYVKYLDVEKSPVSPCHFQFMGGQHKSPNQRSTNTEYYDCSKLLLMLGHSFIIIVYDFRFSRNEKISLALIKI